MRWLRIILIALALGLVGMGLTYALTGAWNRDRNMAKAREHALILQPVLARDSRFTKIEVYDDYRHGGMLLITGTTASKEDLGALHEIVEASNPPVPVRWDVDVESNS